MHEDCTHCTCWKIQNVAAAIHPLYIAYIYRAVFVRLLIFCCEYYSLLGTYTLSNVTVDNRSNIHYMCMQISCIL